MEISTSILSVKNENVVRTFYDIEVAGADYFHIDVMDGKFVEKDTSAQMAEYANTICNISNLPLDVHLMVNNPKDYINSYSSLGAKFITVHYESFKSSKEILETIEYIKNSGARAGISIKPNTDITEILEYLPYISLLLVMTVEPGKGGQDLIPNTIEKIRKIYEYREKENLDFFIEADGGINIQNIKQIENAGSDIAVVGTAIVNEQNKKDIINKLKNTKN